MGSESSGSAHRTLDASVGVKWLIMSLMTYCRHGGSNHLAEWQRSANSTMRGTMTEDLLVYAQDSLGSPTRKTLKPLACVKNSLAHLPSCLIKASNDVLIDITNQHECFELVFLYCIGGA